MITSPTTHFTAFLYIACIWKNLNLYQTQKNHKLILTQLKGVISYGKRQPNR